jgi:hypothetical protein
MRSRVRISTPVNVSRKGRKLTTSASTATLIHTSTSQLELQTRDYEPGWDLDSHLEPDVVTEHGEVTWQTDVGQVRLGHRKLWVTSLAGEHEVRVECLPGSSLPATLRKIGYQLTRGQDGQRILPVAVTHPERGRRACCCRGLNARR